MRTVVAIFALCAVSVGVAAGESSQPGLIAAAYDSEGPEGVLKVSGPDGTQFCAMDANGMSVAEGVIAGGAVEMFAPNAGPNPEGGLLTVFVGPEVFNVGNGYDDWWW